MFEEVINFIKCNNEDEFFIVSEHFISLGYHWCSGIRDSQYLIEGLNIKKEDYPIVVGLLPFSRRVDGGAGAIFFRYIDDIDPEIIDYHPYQINEFDDLFYDHEFIEVIDEYVDNDGNLIRVHDFDDLEEDTVDLVFELDINTLF